MMRASFAVTTADTPICAYLGGEGDIPIIELGDPYAAADFSITVNSRCLTPHEQVAFLRRLSAQIEALAVSVANTHAVPVSGVAS